MRLQSGCAATPPWWAGYAGASSEVKIPDSLGNCWPHPGRGRNSKARTLTASRHNIPRATGSPAPPPTWPAGTSPLPGSSRASATASRPVRCTSSQALPTTPPVAGLHESDSAIPELVRAPGRKTDSSSNVATSALDGRAPEPPRCTRGALSARTSTAPRARGLRRPSGRSRRVQSPAACTGQTRRIPLVDLPHPRPSGKRSRGIDQAATPPRPIPFPHTTPGRASRFSVGA